MIYKSLLLFVAVLFSIDVKAKQPPNTAFDSLIPFIDVQIVVDGSLNEPQWQTANQISLDIVTRPFENTKPPVDTVVKFFENGDALNIAFIAQDPDVNAIRAFLSDRDKSWSDDLVGIKLDPFNDGRLAYQFFVNPLGVQIDSIENEMTGEESDSWNGIWYSAGKITDEGYIVEISIPLRLLNFQESENEKEWGIEFVRFYPRSDNYRISQVPFDRNNACILCQLGSIKGFKNAKQGKNLAIAPTAVLASGRSRDPKQGKDWRYQNNQEVGVDIKWAISPEIGLSGTLNPDFSQVEADVAQLGINNTFTLFFDEQRPFFVENADFFATDQTLIYTRNIASPDYGAKITGRAGKHSFGLFTANDETTTLIIPGNIGSSVANLDESSNNVGLRYRFDYSKDLSVGYISTLRQASDYHNYVNGIDGKYRLTDKDTLNVQIVSSITQYPEQLGAQFCDQQCKINSAQNETALRTEQDDEFSGVSYRVKYNHNSRNYFFQVQHFYNDEDFRADLGFESKADFTKSVIGGGYIWWNENSWWNRIRLNGDWDITHNMQGELLEKEWEGYLSIRGEYQSYVEIGATSRTRVGLRQQLGNLNIDNNADQFEEQYFQTYFEIRPISYLLLGNFFRKGDNIDFANNRLGKQVLAEPFITINAGKHLKLDLQHSYTELDSDDKPLFIANLTDARLTYQFDARQFLRLVVAYSDVDRNQQNYSFDVDKKSRNLGYQLLYSYKLNPLTKFFVGYSDSAFSNDDIQKLTINNQSLFMKVSYAWLQ